jgi:hypothetical protein
LLGLHRSIDLTRTLRTVSFAGSVPFVLIKRKGWRSYKWEEVMSIPSHPHISPWHLMQKYVAMTSHLVPPGSPVFVGLPASGKKGKPLCSSTIGGLTRRLLQKHQVPPQWGAHSTRGAGVLFLKNWVCPVNRFVKL